MKTFVLLLALLIVPYCLKGSNRDEEKIALQKLVAEREARFGDYSRAAAAKSGIFGNKTKNDLREQLNVLTEIIKTDNRIISLLKNFLDYRTFQRTELTYSQAELDGKNRRLDELTTSLSSRLEQSNKNLKACTGSLKWARALNWFLFILLVITFCLLWKQRKLSTG